MEGVAEGPVLIAGTLGLNEKVGYCRGARKRCPEFRFVRRQTKDDKDAEVWQAVSRRLYKN